MRPACLVCAIFFLACATPGKPVPAAPFEPALTQIANVFIQNFEGEISIGKTFYLYSPNILHRIDNELAQRFRWRFADRLNTGGVRIKTARTAEWESVTTGRDSIRCPEVIATIAADYLVRCDFLSSAVGPSVKTVQVQVFQDGGNEVIFSHHGDFSLTNEMARWDKPHKLSPEPGNKEKPFVDLDNAADQIAKKISCLFKYQISDAKDTVITVGKTDRTLPGAAQAFENALSRQDLMVTPSRHEWMRVLLTTGDRFELPEYRREYRQPFETAKIVLAVDMKPAERAAYVRTALLSLSETRLADGRRLGAGMVVPKCEGGGYVAVREQLFAPPVQIEADIIVHRNDQSIPLGVSGMMRTGESYKIRVKTTEPSHIYIAQVDGQGKGYAIFPNACVKWGSFLFSKNPVPAETEITFPAGESEWLTLFGRPGKETVYIFADRKSHPEIETVMNGKGWEDVCIVGMKRNRAKERHLEPTSGATNLVGKLIAKGVYFYSEKMNKAIMPAHGSTIASDNHSVDWSLFSGSGEGVGVIMEIIHVP